MCSNLSWPDLFGNFFLHIFLVYSIFADNLLKLQLSRKLLLLTNKNKTENAIFTPLLPAQNISRETKLLKTDTIAKQYWEILMLKQ